MVSSLSRRSFVLALAAFHAVPAQALIDVEDELSRFSGGASVLHGRVTVGIEDVIADGFTVPIELKAESAMTEQDRVEAMLLLAPANPFGKVAVYEFTPLSGEARLSTRIRLARSQTLIAVARYADGRCWSGSHKVDVQTNGCEP
jgi:sulfur-oxidizing protein SoxY